MHLEKVFLPLCLNLAAKGRKYEVKNPNSVSMTLSLITGNNQLLGKSRSSLKCVQYIYYRVYTCKFVKNTRTFQRLLKDSPKVFKVYKFMKNTDLHIKILLPEYWTLRY